MKNIIVILILGLNLTSCKQNEVEGILIGHTLCENQSIAENRELSKLINQTLSKDENALAKLIDFWCGGGAGCYDLGFIVTQIIYKLGEKDFMSMANKLDKNQLNRLEGLIIVGLEYGDHDTNRQVDNKTIENEFPELLKQIEAKQNKSESLTPTISNA